MDTRFAVPSSIVGTTDPLVHADGMDFFYGEGESRFQVLFEIGLDVLPEGPVMTISCQGRPIRSMVANLAPPRSSRSS